MYQGNSALQSNQYGAGTGTGSSGYWASNNSSSNMNSPCTTTGTTGTSTGYSQISNQNIAGLPHDYNTNNYKSTGTGDSYGNTSSTPGYSSSSSSYYQQNEGSHTGSGSLGSSVTSTIPSNTYRYPQQQNSSSYMSSSYSGGSSSFDNSVPQNNSNQSGTYSSTSTYNSQNGTNNWMSGYSTNSKSTSSDVPVPAGNQYDDVVTRYAQGHYSTDNYAPVKTSSVSRGSFRGRRQGSYRGGGEGSYRGRGEGSYRGRGYGVKRNYSETDTKSGQVDNVEGNSPLENLGDAKRHYNSFFDKYRGSNSRVWEPRAKKIAIPMDDSIPIPVELDPNLPVEIVGRMRNSRCDICAIDISSYVVARHHYEGKPHARKVKRELDILNPPEVKQPPLKKKKGKQCDAVAPDGKPIDIDNLHCKTCDISFTSTSHATSHYLGRNHARRVHGLKPLEAGYVNPQSGNWQRDPPDPTIASELITPAELAVAKQQPPTKFSCNLCSVNCSNQDQLDMHLGGKPHAKKLKLKDKAEKEAAAFSLDIGVVVPSEKPIVQVVETTGDDEEVTGTVIPVFTSNAPETETILGAAVSEGQSKKNTEGDFSVNRTPSVPVEFPNIPEELAAKMKNSFCEICSTILSSLDHAKSHYTGRKHEKRLQRSVNFLNLDGTTRENFVLTSVVKEEDEMDADGNPVTNTTDTTTELPTAMAVLSCKLCEKEFSSNIVAVQHYTSKFHAKKMSEVDPQLNMYINPLTGEYQSDPPKAIVEADLVKADTRSGKGRFKTRRIQAVGSNLTYFCDLCCVGMTSREHMDSHMTGKHHIKAVKQVALQQEIIEAKARNAEKSAGRAIERAAKEVAREAAREANKRDAVSVEDAELGDEPEEGTILDPVDGVASNDVDMEQEPVKEEESTIPSEIKVATSVETNISQNDHANVHVDPKTITDMAWNPTTLQYVSKLISVQSKDVKK